MTMWRLRSYALNRARACFCFRSRVPMMMRPAEPQLLKRRVASHPAGDAASSINQATWSQSVMPTPRSIYIRRGSSSQMTLRCPATAILTEGFRAYLSNDDHLEPHFRIIESPARRRRYGAPWKLAEPRRCYSLILTRSVAVREDKRVDTTPLRYAEPVCLDLPGLDRLSGGTRLPNSLVMLT